MAPLPSLERCYVILTSLVVDTRGDALSLLVDREGAARAFVGRPQRLLDGVHVQGGRADSYLTAGSSDFEHISTSKRLRNYLFLSRTDGAADIL